MIILHLSDTHGCHRLLQNLPGADIIVHSGDFTMDGSEGEVMDFLNWFCDLPYHYKIFIGGNHDDFLNDASIEGLGNNTFYLSNSGVEICGLKFYGVPMFISDCISSRQSYNYSRIPFNTDVLITHSPPYGILDFEHNIHYGSLDLLHSVMMIKPRLHLFGHIHSQRRITTSRSTIFSNGVIMSEKSSTFNPPNIIKI